MTTIPNPNDLLMGSGSKSASFKGNPPITYSGPIVANPTVQQQTNLKGELLTFADGSPRYQLVVQIQTTERDPADNEDDGIRALYIKANSQKAVAAAVRAAGAKGLEVGGTLTLTYTGDDVANQKRGYDAPKLYTATYQPPNSSGQFLGTAPAQPAAAQPATAQAPVDNSPEAFLRSQGVDVSVFPAGTDLSAMANLMRQAS